MFVCREMFHHPSDPFLLRIDRCVHSNKKDGGIRPIAIGSTLRGLVAKTAAKCVQEKNSTNLTGFLIENLNENLNEVLPKI